LFFARKAAKAQRNLTALFSLGSCFLFLGSFFFPLAKKGSREDQDPFASLREKKKEEYLPAMLRDRQQRREGLPAEGRRKDQDLFAAWFLCEIPIKKTLAKKDNLSQVKTSFFRAKTQRPARRGGRKEM